MGDTGKGGARRSDQALAVPVEPVSRLDPTGFDPSRELSPIGSYCRPCGKMTDGSECPFCGQMATPLDELAEARTFGGHAYKCDYWHDHYPHECTCGATA